MSSTNDKDYDEQGYVIRPNKTAQKREIAAIAEIIETLIAMPDGALKSMPLDDKVREAILTARKLSKSALRRQRLYINKLLRNSDMQSLEDTLAQWQQRHQLQNQHFHQLEQWRDQLIGGNEQLAEQLLTEYETLERGELFKLIHQAKREHDAGKAPAAARQLFKYLRECC